MRTLCLALLAGALCLTFAAPASASRDQESIFEDEHQLLELGSFNTNRSLDDIHSLGADSMPLESTFLAIAASDARGAVA